MSMKAILFAAALLIPAAGASAEELAARPGGRDLAGELMQAEAMVEMLERQSAGLLALAELHAVDYEAVLAQAPRPDSRILLDLARAEIRIRLLKQRTAAWRALLSDAGVDFSEEIVITDGEGIVAERWDLSEDPRPAGLNRAHERALTD